MAKAPDAFRTISEVADWLDVPTHVLRFWESRFAQVKPVKRAGGRRYYRPGDMELLGGIKRLLHDEGMTIRGVQKLLREEGVRHVAALSPPLDSTAPDEERGKVITLTRAGLSTSDGPPDRWPFTDDADLALDALNLDGPAESISGAEEDVADVFSMSEAEADAEPGADAPEEAPDENVEEHVAETAALPFEPESEPHDARAPFDVVPFPDLEALSLPFMPIAMLASMGRAARARRAQALSPIATEAEVLARAWDARI